MKLSSKLIVIGVMVLNLVYTAAISKFYFEKMISVNFFAALLFLQTLVMSILIFNYYMYRRFQDLARSLGFKYMSLFLEEPRMEGNYKDNNFQLHFRQMERGDKNGMLRSYVKIQWKDLKEFDTKKLKKYSDYRYENNSIISVEHITRTYKNYLLLRREWFTFDKKNIYHLMDLLIKISKECEIKPKKK